MTRWTATLLASIFVAYLAWQAGIFTHPYYDLGDDAANSLSILRAKHFAQLYGCFSRWGFYHPGPAAFYVQGAGEGIFYDWLGLCRMPHRAQQLAQIVLNACLLANVLRTFTLWLPAGRRRWWFVVGALAFAAIHFADGRRAALTSTWPTYPPVLLMLGLLAASTAVATGEGTELPALMLTAGFLLHTHVAQPLFVVPLTLLAYGGLWWRCAAGNAAPFSLDWNAAWRAWPRVHLISVGLLATFALPLVIDALRGTDSNLAAIWQHIRHHRGEHKTWLRSFCYFLQFGAYDYYAGPARADFGHYDRAGMWNYLRAHVFILTFWLGVACAAAWAVLRSARHPAPAALMTPEQPRRAGDTTRFLAWAGVFFGAAVVLTLYWGTIQDGQMFYYNAFFNYGIYSFGALVALANLCNWARVRLNSSRARRVADGALLAAGCLVVVVFTVQARKFLSTLTPKPYAAELYQHVAGLIDATRTAAAAEALTPRFLVVSPDWNWGTAVGLTLSRNGLPFLVPPEYKVMFGAEHAWQPADGRALANGLQIWRVHRTPLPTAPPVLPPVRLSLDPPVYLSVTAPVIDPNLPDGPAATIDYRPDGNAAAYALFGWSEPEPWGTWNDGRQAMLAFVPQPVKDADIELRVEATPLLAPQSGVSGQRLRVFFNGEALGDERQVEVSTAAKPLVFVIPAAVWNRSVSRKFACAVLGFEFPDAASPAQLDTSGQSRDFRLLAFGFRALRFRKVESVSVP